MRRREEQRVSFPVLIAVAAVAVPEGRESSFTPARGVGRFRDFAPSVPTRA